MQANTAPEMKMLVMMSSDSAVLTDNCLQGVTRQVGEVRPERLHSQNVG